MQAKRVFAVEAKKYIAVTVASLKELRNDSNFDEFWSGVKQNADKLDVDEPVLPRKRKAPTRLDPTSSTAHADNTPEDLYRRLYYEVNDTLLGEIDLIQILLNYMGRLRRFCSLVSKENLILVMM